MNVEEVPSYLAHCDASNLIMVAAVDAENRLDWASNYGKEKVDIAARGVDVFSTWAENSNYTVSGTSFAAPEVTKAIAKIKFSAPDLGPEEVFSLLEESATPVPSLQAKLKFGGVLNEEGALELAKELI